MRMEREGRDEGRRGKVGRKEREGRRWGGMREERRGEGRNREGEGEGRNEWRKGKEVKKGGRDEVKDRKEKERGR